MNVRHTLALILLSLSFTGCLSGNSNPDGGTDGPDASLPSAACTGGCGPNQICDLISRTCVDACGGCDEGVCTRNDDGTVACVVEESSCGGNTCQEGQNSCVAGACSCNGFDKVAVDSCAAQGKICNQSYNPVTMTGGVCEAPKIYQACKGTGAACPSGSSCVSLFSGVDDVCLKQCSGDGTCDVGDVCAQFSQIQSFCLPASLVGDNCVQPSSDGGTSVVPVSNTCLLRNADGGFEGPSPTGNCSYAFMRFSNQEFEFATCRAPGMATEGQACRREFARGTEALQCSTGLECMPVNGLDGVCQRMCNAAIAQSGFVPSPSCASGEACVNLYRKEDINAVLGVCTPRCDLFDASSSTCASIGSVEATCVPTGADGFTSVTNDGKGICLPVKSNAKGLGEACADADALGGSTCASGLVCNVTPSGRVCEQPCHLACSGENAPAECASWSNATCPSGKVCSKVNSSPSATLGFCR